MTPPDPDLSAAGSPHGLRSKNDAFISYSRKDKGFAERLVARFHQLDRGAWIDWDDIHKGEDWWNSIQRGIEESDRFIFIISPDSVTSTVCRKEISYAAQLNKQMLPLLRREGFNSTELHPSIAQYNWIFCRDDDDVDLAFRELFRSLDTDLLYVRAHTRMIMRSLEWWNSGRDGSYLLRGTDLDDGQRWLGEGIRKLPKPTDAQIEYINASTEASFAALRARQKAKWTVVLTTVIANFVFVTGGLYGMYWSANEIARHHVARAMERTLNAALVGIDGDEFMRLTRDDSFPGHVAVIDSPIVRRHQSWLDTVHRIAPQVYPATYAVDSRGNRLIAIADIKQALGSNQVAPLKSDYPQSLATSVLWQGLEKASFDLSPGKDRLGREWVAVYGPIHTRTGQVVGGLALYHEASQWTDLRDAIGRCMLMADALAFTWLLISSVVILRATRPHREGLLARHSDVRGWRHQARLWFGGG